MYHVGSGWAGLSVMCQCHPRATDDSALFCVWVGSRTWQGGKSTKCSLIRITKDWFIKQSRVSVSAVCAWWTLHSLEWLFIFEATCTSKNNHTVLWFYFAKDRNLLNIYHAHFWLNITDIIQKPYITCHIINRFQNRIKTQKLPLQYVVSLL